MPLKRSMASTLRFYEPNRLLENCCTVVNLLASKRKHFNYFNHRFVKNQCKQALFDIPALHTLDSEKKKEKNIAALKSIFGEESTGL